MFIATPAPSSSGAAKRRPEEPRRRFLGLRSSGLRFAPPEDDAGLRTHVVSTKREALTHAGRPVFSRRAVGLGFALDDLAAEEAVDEVDEEQRAAAAHVEEGIELDDIEGGDEA
jgi:hypothetical protein